MTGTYSTYAVDPLDQQADVIGPRVQTALENGALSEMGKGWTTQGYTSKANELYAAANKAELNGELNAARTLRQQALDLDLWARTSAPRVEAAHSVGGLRDALDFGLAAAGSGGRTMVQPIVAGGAGTLAGTLIGGPLGGLIGGTLATGAAMYPENRNEIVGTASRDPNTRATAQEVSDQADLYGALSTGLDVIPAVGVAGRMITGIGKSTMAKATKEIWQQSLKEVTEGFAEQGIRAARKDVLAEARKLTNQRVGELAAKMEAEAIAKKGVARYVGEGAALNTLGESATEGGQDILGQIAQNELSGQSGIDLRSVGDAMAAAAVPGAMAGTAGHGASAVYHETGVVDKARERFNDLYGVASEKAGELYGAGKEEVDENLPGVMDTIKGVSTSVRDAAGRVFEGAGDSYKEGVGKAAMSGEEVDAANMHGRGIGAAIRTVVDNAGELSKELNTQISEAIGKKVEGTTVGEALMSAGDIIADAKGLFAPEKSDKENIQDIDFKQQRVVQGAVGKVRAFIDMTGLQGEDVQRFAEIEQKAAEGKRLSNDDKTVLGNAMRNIGKVSHTLEKLTGIAGGEGPHSYAKKKSAEDQLINREFRDDVYAVARDLFAGHPMSNDPATLHTATHALEDLLAKIATGVKDKKSGVSYSSRARALGEFLTGEFGEAGKEALAKLTQIAAARYGADSAQLNRLESIDANVRGLFHLVSKLTEPSGKTKTPLVDTKGANTQQVIDRMLNQLRKAKEADASGGTAQVASLLESAKKASSPEEAYRLRKQAFEAQSSGSAVDALQSTWDKAGLVKAANFERVASLIEKYETHPERFKPPEENPHGSDSGTASNRYGEDENAPDFQQTLAEGAADINTFADGEGRDERDVHTERGVTYHGVEALTGGKFKGGVQTPTSRSVTVDYRDEFDRPTSVYTKVRDEVGAKYGHRAADSSFINMREWATEVAGENNPSRKRLLQQAMQRVLEHDQERLEKLKRTDGSERDIKAVEARIEHAKNVGGDAEAFFEHHKHYGYHKLWQNEAGNLEFTVKQLAATGPNTEKTGVTDKGYVVRQMKRDEEGRGHAFARSVYENSLLEVNLANGDSISVDLPVLIDKAMRHQPGDVEGVTANRRERLVDPNGEVLHEGSKDFAKGVLAAMHSVLAAIIDTKGVDGENAFGHLTESGQALTAMTYGALFKPSMVVYRNVDSRRIYTFGQLTRILGVDPKTMKVIPDGTFMSDTALAEILKTGKGKPTPGDYATAAKKGVLTGAVERDGVAFDLDARGLLRHMLDRNNIDPVDAMSMGKLSNNLAAQLLRQGIRELASKGYEVDLALKSKGTPEFAWGDARLFSREFTEDGEVQTYDVTWASLRNRLNPLIKDTVPVNLDDAALLDKVQRAKDILRELGDLDRQHASGEILTATDSSVGVSEKLAKKEGQLRSAEKAAGMWDRQEDVSRVNTYDPADTANSRILQMLGELRELSGDSGALFDKSAQRLFNDTERLAEAPWDATHVSQLDRLYEAFAELEGNLQSATSNWSTGDQHGAQRSGGKALGVKARMRTEGARYDGNAVLGKALSTPEAAAEREAAATKARAELAAEKPAPAPVVEEPATIEPVKPTPTVQENIREMAPAGQIAALAKMSEADKQKLYDSLPPESRRTRQEKFLARKLEGMGVVGSTPFSKAKKGENVPPNDRSVYEQEFKRLLGDLFGFSTTDEAVEWAGKFTKDQQGRLKEAILSLYNITHAEAMGATRHEAWHGVEQLLKELGPEGQKVLDTIARYVDSPMMRRWLESKFKDQPQVLEQINGTGEFNERAAHVFALFMRGDKMPLAAPVRTIFQKIKAFVDKAFNWAGLKTTSDAERALAFFKYVGEANFLRDAKNPAAVLRGLGETKTDKFIGDARGAVKPLVAAFNAAMEHTATRVRELNNPAYTELLELYEGKSGKGGYNGQMRMERRRFFNLWYNLTNGKTPEQIKAMMKPGGEIGNKFTNVFRRYLDTQLSEKEVNALYTKVNSFNMDLINERFAEFLNDLATHGGLEGVNTRTVASQIANSGYFYDGVHTLFEANGAVGDKWRAKDPAQQAYRLISKGVEMVERRRIFGDNDASIERLLKKGEKSATPEQHAFMRKVVDAYEGRLGMNELSPELRQLSNALMTANNIRLLPFAIFSQLMEPLQLAARRGNLGGAFDSMLRGIKDLPRSFQAFDRAATKDRWEQLSESAGTISHDIFGSSMSKLTAGYSMTGWTAKINDTFFRYNLMDQWNRSMHIAATRDANEFIVEHARTKGEKSTRYLTELGLTRADVKVDKDGVLDISSDKIRRAVAQYVDEALAHPDAGSNPLWMSDARFALLAHMKRFTFGFTRYVLQRGVDRMKEGDLNVVAAAALAVPFMIAVDGLKDAINPLSDTTYKNNWSTVDYLGNGIERASLVGRWQFPLDMMHKAGRGGEAITALLGPDLNMISDAVRAIK